MDTMLVSIEHFQRKLGCLDATYSKYTPRARGRLYEGLGVIKWLRRRGWATAVFLKNIAVQHRSARAVRCMHACARAMRYIAIDAMHARGQAGRAHAALKASRLWSAVPAKRRVGFDVGDSSSEEDVEMPNEPPDDGIPPQGSSAPRCGAGRGQGGARRDRREDLLRDEPGDPPEVLPHQDPQPLLHPLRRLM